MWTMRRSHQHISTETLSEYIDGRLRSGALARIEGHVASCELCRYELESLRDLVTMLQDLPAEEPSRSFTMHAPPPRPIPVRPTPLLRAPQWAYAAVASVAAILLIVLVSFDATGLLVPEKETVIPIVESLAQLQVQSETAQVAAEARQSTVEEVVTVERESAVAAPAAPATSVAAFEASPTTVAMAAVAEAITESAAPNGIEVEESELQSEVDTTERELRTTPSEDQTRVFQRQEPEQSIDGQTAFKEMTVPAQEATAAFWRVLEGLAGSLGLVFLAGLVLKWKNSRRSGRV